MSKDSLTNSFIVKIKWVNEKLRITLQNIHTREMIELSTWPELFKELVSQPLEGGGHVTLPQDVLEHMNNQSASRRPYTLDASDRAQDDSLDEEGDRSQGFLNTFDASL